MRFRFVFTEGCFNSDLILQTLQRLRHALSMHAGTIAVVAGELHRVPILVLLPGQRGSPFQPGHVHVPRGLGKVCKFLAKEKKVSWSLANMIERFDLSQFIPLFL